MPTSPPDTDRGRSHRIRRLWIVLAAVVGLAVVVRIALPSVIAWAVGWGALRQAMVGAATIPLKALGGIFGGDGGVDFEPIRSLPGAAQIGGGGEEKLAGLMGRGRIRRALEKRAEGERLSLSEEDQAYLRHYLAGVEVADERYDNLARDRARAVQRYILGTERVDASRVELTDSRRGPPGVAFTFDAIPLPDL